MNKGKKNKFDKNILNYFHRFSYKYECWQDDDDDDDLEHRLVKLGECIIQLTRTHGKYPDNDWLPLLLLFQGK